jgi:hypothetical protein
MLGSQGRLLWQNKMRFPVKELDLSKDGSLSVVGTFGNEILGLNAKGKTLWSVEATCKPIILNESKRVLCYHDDDAEPSVAFGVLIKKN